MAGNVVAPDAGVALLYAREFYGSGRRASPVVCPRECIVEITTRDLLHPPAVDRS